MPILTVAHVIPSIAKSAVQAALRSGDALTRDFLVKHACGLNTDAGRIFMEAKNEHAIARLENMALYEARQHEQSYLNPKRGVLGSRDGEGTRQTVAGHVRSTMRYRRAEQGERMVRDGFELTDLTGSLESRHVTTLAEARTAADEMETLIARRLAAEYVTMHSGR